MPRYNEKRPVAWHRVYLLLAGCSRQDQRPAQLFHSSCRATCICNSPEYIRYVCIRATRSSRSNLKVRSNGRTPSGGIISAGLSSRVFPSQFNHIIGFLRDWLLDTPRSFRGRNARARINFLAKGRKVVDGRSTAIIAFDQSFSLNVVATLVTSFHKTR